MPISSSSFRGPRGIQSEAMNFAGSCDRAPEDLDAAFAQRDDGALAARALAEAGLRPLALALAVERVDVADLDAEDLLDRDLDLGLVGVRADQERVLVLVEQAVALLGDDRREQHVARVGEVGHAEPSSVVADSVLSDSVLSDSVLSALASTLSGAASAVSTDGAVLSMWAGSRSSPEVGAVVSTAGSTGAGAAAFFGAAS